MSASSHETAGDGFKLTVTAYDAYGNVATQYQGTATLTSGDGQEVSPSTVSFGSSPGVATVDATLDKADTTTLKATAGSVKGTSNSITVQPAAAASFSLNAPTPETVGDGFNLTVTAHDKYGNIATGYSGTAALTSSDGQKVSPSTVAFDPSGQTPGVATVTVTLDEPDTTTLTAAAGSVTGKSASITVDSATYTATLGGWTGYTSSPGSGVTAVGATWVQPTITGSDNGGASIWVGIDGWNGPTVEQCGVDDQLVNGTPQYFAWYEFFGDKSSSERQGARLLYAAPSFQLFGSARRYHFR